MDDPSPELIAEWKTTYDEVLSIEADGQLFVYRTLTFSEFDTIIDGVSDGSSSVDIEDALIDLVLLWPINFDIDKCKPGVISVLAEKIRESSCLDGEVYRSKEVLDIWRSRVNGIRGEMKTFIMFAMSSYTSKDLDNITFYRLAELVALSEKVIELRQLSEGVEMTQPIRLNIFTPEEIEIMNSQKMSMGGTATVADPIAQKLMESM